MREVIGLVDFLHEFLGFAFGNEVNRAAAKARAAAEQQKAAEAAEDPLARLEKAILAVSEEQAKVGQLQSQLAGDGLDDAARKRLQLQLDAAEARLAILKRSVTDLEAEVMA